jgi:beta-glucosidase-like glycosyl hydrolase
LTSKKRENGAMKIPSLKQAVAQMAMPRIEGKKLLDAAYRHAMAALAEEGIGGFILFGGDIDSTPRYLAELQARAEFPLLISSDVERGLGQQLEGGTRFPSQRAVASALVRCTKKDVDLLGRMLDAVRTESRTAGIHIVFSPVMDVNNNPDNPIICTRSFGEEPETVEWFGRHYIRGLQKPGADGHRDLLACAKHFPGHGDTDQDSHSVLPVIRVDRALLNRVELPPFREAVKDGVGTVMIAHLLVPALDPVKPVTFSKKVVTALLREGMEFNGLIISDALDMGALAGEYSQDEIAIRAVEAGMDILLHPVDARITIDAVVKAVKEGRLTETRIYESVDRIMAAKKQLGLFDKKQKTFYKIDYAKHRAIATDLGSKALTVVHGDRKKLPFDSGKGVACFVLDDDGQDMGGPFTHGLMKRFGTVNSTTLTPDINSADLSSHLDLSGVGSVVIGIFSRISASKGRSGLSPKLREAAFDILRRAKTEGKRSAVISFDSPYILDQFKDADVLIAGYDRMDAIQEAAAEMLAGK